MARTSNHGNRAGTGANKRGGRRRATEEERERARRRDEELYEKTREALNDPGRIGAFARRAYQGGMSARILSYSLRNQMMLHEQADERGIVLTDVDTYKGWRERGRHVRRGEQGLRIVRPVGITDDEPTGRDGDSDRNTDRDKDSADNASRTENGTAPAASPTVSVETSEEDRRPKFRSMNVFDISQTDGPDVTGECTGCDAGNGEPCLPQCGCDTCTEMSAADLLTQRQAYAEAGADTPADLLWNRLFEQITGRGYEFDWPADADRLNGTRVRVDHDAKAVHVAMAATAADPAALAELGAALAQILLRADDQARARRAARAQLPAAERQALPAAC